MKMKEDGCLPSLSGDQRGQSYTTMFLLALPLLIVIIGMAYDLSNVAIAQTMAQNAADLAAQEAAKQIDVPHFLAHQQVILAPDALAVANATAAGMTDGRMIVRSLRLLDGGRRIYLEGEVRVKMLILPLIGISEVRREVRAVAEPAFGIQQEGD